MFFVRKTTKTLLLSLIITVLCFLLLTGLFFLRTEVNVIVSGEEEALLKSYFRTPAFSSYRITVSVYPEVKEGVSHLYSPIAALRAADEGAVLPASACWGIGENDSFDLVYTPGKSERWLCAVDADKKLGTALVYNSQSSNEREVASLMPSSVTLIPYDGYVSFISAGEIRKKLDEGKIGTVMIPEPSSAVSLLEEIPDLSLIISTYYKDALETGDPAFVVCEDFDEMINSLLKGEEGVRETPYILLPCKQGLKVLFNKL